MNEFFTFANNHPFWALLMACVAISPLRYLALCYSRHLRARNIAAKGWPPEHLDADGDAIKPKETP